MAGSEKQAIDTEGDSNSLPRRAGILILNAGSSSLKYSLLDSVDQRARIRESLDEPCMLDSGTLASAADPHPDGMRGHHHGPRDRNLSG